MHTMTGIIVGIDPGVTGAIAAVALDGRLDYADDMPTVDRWVSIPLLRGYTTDDRIKLVGLELVRSRPGEGHSGAFKFGDCWGTMRAAFGVSHQVLDVRPQDWKKALRVGKDPTRSKEKSRAKAIELWPGNADLFARKKDSGRAEAALIAEYVRREMRDGAL